MDELLNAHADPSHKDWMTGWLDGWMAGFSDGGFLKRWYPTTMGFPTKNDHFRVFWRYHHLRKHPDVAVCFYPTRPSNLGVLRLSVYLWWHIQFAQHFCIPLARFACVLPVHQQYWVVLAPESICYIRHIRFFVRINRSYPGEHSISWRI